MNPPKGIDPKVWEMAEGVYQAVIDEDVPTWKVDHIYRAIQKGMDIEREECAKIAEDDVPNPKLLPFATGDANAGADVGQYEAAERISQAIRNRSNITTERNEG